MTLTLLLLSLCVLANAQVPLDESSKQGIVEILAVDSLGVPFDGKLSVTAQRLTRGQFEAEIAIPRKATLNYATYRLTIRASPAYPVNKIVTIREPYKPVLVPLFVAPIELPWTGNFIQGEVPEKSRRLACRWVRLISPVSETEYFDAIVGESGKFSLENVKPGVYLAITFGAEGICDLMRTVVSDKRSQILVLH